jgi:hypothetical protein
VIVGLERLLLPSWRKVFVSCHSATLHSAKETYVVASRLNALIKGAQPLPQKP